MMLHDPTILSFYIITNIIAVFMTWLAWKHTRWGRLLFAINFLGAALFNGIFWYVEPEEYSYYSEFVWLDSYRAFILGPFLEHLRLVLGIIVAVQVYIGWGMVNKGWWLKSAAILGIIFLLAIIPFGIGAAFPATLVQSVGLYFIYQKGSDKMLFQKKEV